MSERASTSWELVVWGVVLLVTVVPGLLFLVVWLVAWIINVVSHLRGTPTYHKEVTRGCQLDLRGRPEW